MAKNASPELKQELIQIANEIVADGKGNNGKILGPTFFV
jgi:hypothetical protein